METGTLWNNSSKSDLRVVHEMKQDSNQTNIAKFCPCCSFDLDLFLPDSERCQPTTVADSIDGHADENDSTPLPDITKTLNELMEDQGEESSPIVVVDTHGHAQLDRERDQTYLLEAITNPNGNQIHDGKNKNNDFHVKALACSVEPEDFDATLEYASKSDSILPALGVHPWYIENLPGYSSLIADDESHEKSDTIDLDSLDSEWLGPLEERLLEHPNCLVGEIGLCKIAKWVRKHPSGKSAAMAIQKRVFQKQMILAARLRRPVSVHCVNSHGIFVTAINELIERTITEEDMETMKINYNGCSGSRRYLLPPSIAMHSFTGTAHHVKELLDLERSIDFPNEDRTKRKKKKATKDGETLNRPPLFYFGFSHSVNYAMCTSEKSRKKGKDAVQAVPLNRLLIESDVHSDLDVAGGTVGAISYVAWARNMQARDVMSTTSKNGSNFFGSIRN